MRLFKKHNIDNCIIPKYLSIWATGMLNSLLVRTNDELEKQVYLIPILTKEVIAFFDIDIPYLESKFSSKKLIKNM